MNRSIKKVAILGSGIMGSRIACHFANIGVKVLLLDIAPKNLLPEEEAKGLTLEHPLVKNRIVNYAFQQTIKAKPASLYLSSFAENITLGNFDDNLKDIQSVDWIIEVIVENLEIKKSLYDKVDQLRSPGTLISSNTSGIPIHLMSEGRSEDFQKHFCGTHFFNPPRYLKLLEIIPTPQTDSSVVDFIAKYGETLLGKTTVICKDTPAFIANRIGVYSMMQTMKVVEELGLSVEQVDKLTSKVVGRPKSGTFRLSDVVGLDTTVHVANNLQKALQNDESKDIFTLPNMLQQLMENKWLGDKTGQGFYKKIKGANGKSEILALDLQTFEYRPTQKVSFETLERTKAIDSLSKRFDYLLAGKDLAGEFYRKTFLDGFRYASNRVPEIADEFYKIDQAICAGFGWEMGIFETWDAIGVQKGIDLMRENGFEPAAWVNEMISNGCNSFYQTEAGVRKYYDLETKSYQTIPGSEKNIALANFKPEKVVYQNDDATIMDIGDDILCLEFHSKMNTMGQGVLEGIQKAIDLAEKNYRGLVIGNEGIEAFSAGANLGMLFMYAANQEFDEVNQMIAIFQNTMMRVRYSSIPVVIAPHTLALGGGCEICLHSDKLVAHAETYMGLVEVGVGLIPAGGGTKEMALRMGDARQNGDVELNRLQNAFMNIATAKVSTSAHEARDMNYLRPFDRIVLNRSQLIAEAKKEALALADAGYVQKQPRSNVWVEGKQGLALFKAGIYGMKLGNYISEHDALIANKLAYAICGGDLDAPQMVTEQYLLDLEREAFLSLSGEKKTLERIGSLLGGGKPLRN
ncbi:3-hydroxyacyl-CoA dehydrogenase NAD-binding domain-containing protein [Aquirufa sp. ROCK-SH2]